MRVDRTRTNRFVPPLVALVVMMASPRATAGPGTYDPKTRTFHLTYTYAIVPSLGMTPDQIDQLGAVKEVTGDQDARVRALFSAVSDKLWQASDNRSKIGSLDHVDSVKQADIIISPSGKVGRGGYATPGAIEGRQGHLVLFYEELVDEQEVDEELTILHELSHYLFGLPDEYQDGETSGLCPLQNGDGPGCLMDNYLFNGPRHGWYGRFCADDHNPQAPNPITVLADQSAKQSCRTLVDLFFQSRLKGDDAINPPAGDETGKPTVDDPFTGVFKSLVESTTSFLLDQVADTAGAKKAPPTAAALRSAAQKFLRDQVANNRDSGRLNGPTADDIRRGVDAAIKAALSARVARPKRFAGPILDRLKQKAEGIAVREAARRGRSSSASLSGIFTNGAARDRAIQAFQKAIFAELQKFAKDALNLNDTALAPPDRKLSDAEKSYLNQIALDAAKGGMQDDNSEFARFLQAARVHIRLSQIIARNTLDAADDQGVVGTDVRRLALTEADRDLERLALKGNPFQGFGLRRTLILAPYPVYVDPVGVRIQASDTAAYRDIRSAFIEEFSTLIGRERIIVLPEEMMPPLASPEGRDLAEKVRNVLREIEFAADQVRRNRIDNIVVLEPPGGLPEDLGDQLETLRKRMALNPDVRLDIVIFGQGNIPRRLRDASVRSVGSVLMVSDIDQFGEVAQRLRGEGISGSWVTIPDQGRIVLTPGAAANARDDRDSPQKVRLVPIEALRSKLTVYRYAYPELERTKVVDLTRFPTFVRELPLPPRLTPTLGIFRDLVDSKEPGTRPPGIPTIYQYTYSYKSFEYIRNVVIRPLMPIRPPGDPARAKELEQYRGLKTDAERGRLEAPHAIEYVFPQKIFTKRFATGASPGPYSLLIAQSRWLGELLRTTDPLNRPDKFARVKLMHDRLNELDDVLGRVADSVGKPPLESTDYRRVVQAFKVNNQAKRAVALATVPDMEQDPTKFRGPEDVIYGSPMARRAMQDVLGERLDFYGQAKAALQAKKAEKGPDPTPPHPDMDIPFYEALISRWSGELENLKRLDAFQAAGRGVAPPRPDIDVVFENNDTDLANLRVYLVTLAEIFVDLCNLQAELDRGLHATRPYARYPRDLKPIAPPAGAAANAGADDPQPLRLKPFTAEEDAEFDLVIGFSRPLNIDAVKRDPPALRLFGGDKPDSPELAAPYLQLDAEKTTETLLVYRLPNPSRKAGRLTTGDYYPRLFFKAEHLPGRGGEIDYTFSVASRNPKVLLTASLRQVELRQREGDGKDEAEVAANGVVVTSKNEAIIEALVVAGTSVQNVAIKGSYQQVERGGAEVRTRDTLPFRDDGKWPDTTKGDGVYTTRIVLDPQEKRQKAEYRVFIEARSTDRTIYVPPAENFGKPDRPRQDPDKKSRRTDKAEDQPVDATTLPDVPSFQRATSVDFQVEGSD